MPTLHLYGIDHCRMSIAGREALAFGNTEIHEILPRMLTPAGRGGVSEAMLLSTCNRTELYLAVKGEPTTSPLLALQEFRPETKILDDRRLAYQLQGRAAVEHLFAVAASLRSQVPGDTQIARQLAASARVAREAATMGPLLESATSAALRSAKRVRRETGLMAGRAGTGPAVWHCLRRLTPGGAGEARPIRVLLLGTGMLAEEVATHLAGLEPPSPARAVGRRRVVLAGVWGRDSRKAKQFGEFCSVPALSDAEAVRALGQVDAVVGACRGRVSVLDKVVLDAALSRRAEPLMVVDLGVPRNLDPMMAGCDGILAVSLDEVQREMRERARHRQRAIEQAEGILAAELGRFDQRMEQWPLRPLRAEVYSTVSELLGRWKTEQPEAVRRLSVVLHRTLDEAFRSVIPMASGAIGGNQSSPAIGCR